MLRNTLNIDLQNNTHILGFYSQNKVIWKRSAGVGVWNSKSILVKG